MTQPKFYGAEAPTGGTEYSMDSLDPSVLTDRDACFVIDRTTRTCCIYSLNEFSGAAATAEPICPHVVLPLTEVGDKRWVLVDQITAAGAMPGDMLQAVYDADADSVVDKTYIVELPTSGLVDAEYAGLVVTGRLYGETVAKYELVYMDGATGRWLKADADAGGKFPAVGMAVTAGNNGDAATVLVRGTVRNDAWSWSAAGVSLYLSTVAGGMTETAPVVSGQCVHHIGRTLVATTDVVLFNPSSLWIELA